MEICEMKEMPAMIFSPPHPYGDGRWWMWVTVECLAIGTVWRKENTRWVFDQTDIELMGNAHWALKKYTVRIFREAARLANILFSQL